MLADDVKHSFEILTGKLAHPRYDQYFADVDGCEVVSERVVRFAFKQRNQELHLILATGLPIFSRKWGEGLPFDQVALQEPITSGPYRLESVDFGKSINFRRLPDYWAANLPVRRGMFNFERHDVQVLQGRDRAAGGLQGRRVRLDLRELGQELGARPHRPALSPAAS